MLIERIRARVAHANSTLKGLVGVTIASPIKVPEEYIDIQKAKVKASKSWHF
jgi:hypothetical protein